MHKPLATCSTIDKHHSHQIRVYIEDTDAGGIVYYATYFHFTERARTEWIRTLGYNKDFISTYRLMFVVRELQSTFHKSAQLDDLIQVDTSMTRLAKTYLDMAQNIVDQHGTLLVETSVRIAMIDCDSRRPARIPHDLYNLFRQYNL